MNTWWFEQGIVLHTEFRDGNVPAGFEQLRVFKEALACLPEKVKQVRLRSDTAGYQHDLLRYCATGENSRFREIEFAIGCDVTQEFKKAVAQVEESEWKPIYKTAYGKKYETGVEWAEVCYVPNAIGHSKKGSEYRYLAKRELLDKQQKLPGMEHQIELPFPTMDIKSQRYKVFGIVTNMDWEGENAAWWWIMILALNLNAMMKKLAMEGSWMSKRMKAIRFSFINLAGRVLTGSSSLIIRLTKNNPTMELLINARKRIVMLQPAPSG